MLPKLNNQMINEFLDYSSQGMIFYSVYIWVKKSMDIWVSMEKFNLFIKFCKKYKIKLRYDVKFVKSDDYGLYNNVVWSENLTTTKTLWTSVDSKQDWAIHCFISMNDKNLDNLYKFWWYPVVVWKRVIYKSYQDIVEFWKYLWYPKCCIKNFFQKNDWRYYNFPYEIYKKSKKFDYRCNPFWKDYEDGISYIYHMPCSFGCKNTIKYVDKIIKDLETTESSNLDDIEKFLLFPILSIREQKIYAFDWVVSEDNLSINYKSFYHLWNKNEWDFSDYFEKGNIVKIEWKLVNIYNNSKKIFSYDTSLSKEIEIPFIVKFNKY